MQGTNDLEQMMGDVLDAVLDLSLRPGMGDLSPATDTACWRVVMERTRAEFGASAWGGQDLPMEPQFTEVFRAVRAVDGPVQWGPGAAGARPDGGAFGVQSCSPWPSIPRGTGPTCSGCASAPTRGSGRRRKSGCSRRSAGGSPMRSPVS